IAWSYVRFGQLPRVGAVMASIKPVIIAVVVQALWGLARTAVRTVALAALAAGALCASALGVHELLVLLGAGVVMLAVAAWARCGPALAALVLAGYAGWAPAAAAAAAAPFSLVALFLVFVKVGAVLFGSGYVLLAFLRADLVVRLHWLTDAQLIDAVAVGQV